MMPTETVPCLNDRQVSLVSKHSTRMKNLDLLDISLINWYVSTYRNVGFANSLKRTLKCLVNLTL